MTDKKRIFISHATANDPLVDEIAQKLDPHADLWIDHKKGLSPSDPDWEYALRVAIQSCDAGVFVMTKNALNSKVCKSECLLVQNLGKPLYVIRAEAVEFKEIWLTISLIQYADWLGDADKAITDLTRAINGESGADIPTPARKFTDAGQIHINLPYLSNPLRGRESDVAWIHENLGDGVTQIIATGGMGKSRLCAEIALNYADGAVWYRCDLSKTHSDLQIALREHADLPEGTPFATTQALIIQRKPLVVVDNAESVPDHERKNYVRLLSALAGGGVPILLTSRTTWREFKPRTEHNLTLLDPVNAFEMTRDFVRTEKLVDKMPLTPDKLRDIASAGRYYPRLIEFAIGQLHEFKYEVIIKRLRNLTHEDVRGALDEMITQTVAQMATENHGADAERLLRRLTWLTATVPEAVIVALMPDDMDEDRLADALAVLRRYQFVRYEDATDRYAVAVLMREALGTDPTAFEIYADFYTRRAKEIFVDLEDSPELWADGEGGANFDDVVNIKALGVELMHQTDNGTVGDLRRALAFAVKTKNYVFRRMEAGAWDWLEMGLNAVRALRREDADDDVLLGRESLML
ncbi:MAG: ATP-binding protein, partial [Anaerolineae bacterium]|nr:ATP-binding protein [Anaerolineae bacterium]